MYDGPGFVFQWTRFYIGRARASVALFQDDGRRTGASVSGGTSRFDKAYSWRAADLEDVFYSLFGLFRFSKVFSLLFGL